MSEASATLHCVAYKKSKSVCLLLIVSGSEFEASCQRHFAAGT
jgi:hypothetical protein